ncbi:hypothetical protein ACIBH1_28070 [Nonomuraea sp. NPDC050663]|uniref:hypothetical protein n=1 Tax=Nonomuraea sp. NPDC050663 TaxID=3364370 RepID=UPI00379C0579
METYEVLDSTTEDAPGRGRIVLAAVTVVAVAAAAVLLWPREAAPPPATGASAVPTQTAPVPAPVTATGAPIDVAPAPEREGELPLLPTAFPATLDPAAARPLSSWPLTRAIALFQQYGEQGDGRLLALGEDGGLRELDGLDLAPVTDRDGNRQAALDDTSLSPDGTRAAFAQKDEVVLVELATGAMSRLPLPGFNERVSWRPNGIGLLVEQDPRVYLMDTRTGVATRMPYPAWGLVAGGEIGADVHRLDADDGEKPAMLSRWDSSGVRQASTPVRPPVGTGEWWGTGWLREGRIARDVFGAGGPRPYGDVVEAEAVVVLDAATGATLRSLVFEGFGRWKGCCAVMGWYDRDTVLVTSGGEHSRLLAWRITDGAVFRVGDLPAQMGLSLGIKGAS